MEDEYGKQRLWGTVGWGISALISGSLVDLFSEDEVNYLPAFIILLTFLVFDVISCLKLRVGVTEYIFWINIHDLQ